MEADINFLLKYTTETIGPSSFVIIIKFHTGVWVSPSKQGYTNSELMTLLLRDLLYDIDYRPVACLQKSIIQKAYQ